MDLIDPAAAALIVLAGLMSGCASMPRLIIPRDPLSAEEHTRLGSTYEAQGQKKEAAEQYESALRKDPSYLPAWMASGDAAFEAGDYAGAERRFRRALKLSPRHAGAANNLAMVFLAQNANLPEAERLAQDALAQDGPLKPFILDTLANVYLREKRYAEASAALEQAQAAAPAGNDAVRRQLLATRLLIDAATPRP